MVAGNSQTAATQLTLPPLEPKPRKHATGLIRCVLDPGGAFDVDNVGEVRVSPRRKEKLYTLKDGSRIVVTTRKHVPRPSDVTGVLRATDAEEPRWISHQLTEDFQEAVATGGLSAVKAKVSTTWAGAFEFRTERRAQDGTWEKAGLRPPQIGALHAIGSHWSLHTRPATIVMPTGTGKTETMLASLLAYDCGTVLVVVPSQALREQTATKFMTLGLLRSLGNIPETARNPVVGILTKRPRTVADLDIFDECNVVVATMSALGQGTAADLGSEIAKRVTTLIVDEAHHVAARTWSAYREHFAGRRILQFTATPYRRDGKLVDGDVIYNYPLRTAQQDGYFKPISFQPIYEIDPEDGDRAIATAAVTKLRDDIRAGHNHLLMARCSTIERAAAVHATYQSVASDLRPLLVHSEASDTQGLVEDLRNRRSRIVVCVDMLGEGFDLPELKVAAVHDTHKSLAVLLQFTGRFTRTHGAEVGNATVVANIANQEVSDALERLYSEDADWNVLLSEFSSQAVKEHAELVAFLSDSQKLSDDDDSQRLEISHSLLRPKFSTVVYDTASFHPKRFFEGLAGTVHVAAVWLHGDSRTLYFVTVDEPTVPWSRSQELCDRQWHLFILHHDPKYNLLYVHSSDKSSTHEKLAQAVGGRDAQLKRGDVVFRALGNIGRLVFHNIGVRKHGRRNLRYALYTGADVAEALSISERAGSVKSNLFGGGWEEGRPVTIGCSYKGRIWTREQGAVPAFVKWCQTVGSKLQDSSIDTAKIIDNVLIPEEVDAVPDARVLSIDWPIELLHQSEERVLLRWDDREEPLSVFGIKTEEHREATGALRFRVFSDDVSLSCRLQLGGSDGFRVEQAGGPPVAIKVGRLETRFQDYLNDYPPLVRFMDMSELDGNLLVRPKDIRELSFPAERFEVWEWEGTDITVESLWKEGVHRSNSIQARAASHYTAGSFDLVFDDDGSGEAADLVCLKEEDDCIRLALVHCKYSGGDSPGERVADVVEVCSQAVRSAKWKWRFKELCRHLASRDKRLSRPGPASRFIVGHVQELNRFVRTSRFKEVRVEIVIVQPGLSQEHCTAEQRSVLAATHSFLKETVNVDLDVVCSA